MTSETFDIINGPAGPVIPAEETWADGPRFSKGFIVGSVIAFAALVAAVWAVVSYPAYAAAYVLGFLLISLLGAGIGKFVNYRLEAKRSWLETEIELSWFRSLNQTGSDVGSIDSDIWQRSSEDAESAGRINDYERGFRAGYARGLQDGA